MDLGRRRAGSCKAHRVLTRAERLQHQARFPHRLPRRRSGLGRRPYALSRPHAPDQRHDHHRCGRPAPSPSVGAPRCPGGLAFPQGAGCKRHHGGQSGEVRQIGAQRYRRRDSHLRRGAPELTEADRGMDDARRRRAPLRFRRPLRLHLADRAGLCRQHRDDPRSPGPGPSGGGRSLVDPGPMGSRR